MVERLSELQASAAVAATEMFDSLIDDALAGTGERVAVVWVAPPSASNEVTCIPDVRVGEVTGREYVWRVLGYMSRNATLIDMVGVSLEDTVADKWEDVVAGLKKAG